MSLNPGTVYWMDMTFFTLIWCQNRNDVCLKRPKINEKGGRGWPILFVIKNQRKISSSDQ